MTGAHFPPATPLLLGVAAATMIVAWLATGLVRSHAIRTAMLDIPNQRSSHTTPTPRGGGATIAVLVLLSTIAVAVTGWLPLGSAIAIGGGGAVVAGIGWLDDRHTVKASWRAAAHLCAAAWAVYWIGGVGHSPLDRLGALEVPLETALAILAIAWMTNLYNFMDGIDGIAAVEAIFVGGVGAIVLLLSGASGLAVICATIVGSSAGFLVWNRMPARIFMGDVGSGFLGFVFATIALSANRTTVVPTAVWILLLLAFLTDATITLVRRVARGDRWHLAHRLHAYQRLAQSGLSHAQVVAWVAALDVFLAGLAIVAYTWPTLAWQSTLLGVLLAVASYWVVERRLGMWAAT
ncbi:MAG: glycosyltransferase family 4 protein [Gemmatimonadaceae bacterium]